jgi:hypothetical protein
MGVRVSVGEGCRDGTKVVQSSWAGRLHTHRRCCDQMPIDPCHMAMTSTRLASTHARAAAQPSKAINLGDLNNTLQWPWHCTKRCAAVPPPPHRICPHAKVLLRQEQAQADVHKHKELQNDRQRLVQRLHGHMQAGKAGGQAGRWRMAGGARIASEEAGNGFHAAAYSTHIVQQCVYPPLLHVM